METLTVLAIVVLGAAAFVALGVFRSSQAEPEPIDHPTGQRKRSGPRVLGGLVLAFVGGLVALVSYGGWATGYILCTYSHPFKSAWYSLESPGNAVAVTSLVLELDRLCDEDRTLRISARARPWGGKPIFLGAGGLVPTRRYLGAGGYEIAETFVGLDDTHRVGHPGRRLSPPTSKLFWRSGLVYPTRRPDAVERITHEWRAKGARPLPFSKEFGTPPRDRFWLVLMNADGSPGVAAHLRYEVGTAPRTRWPWLIGVLAGIGLVGAGIAFAMRRPGPRSARDG